MRLILFGAASNFSPGALPIRRRSFGFGTTAVMSQTKLAQVISALCPHNPFLRLTRLYLVRLNNWNWTSGSTCGKYAAPVSRFGSGRLFEWRTKHCSPKLVWTDYPPLVQKWSGACHEKWTLLWLLYNHKNGTLWSEAAGRLTSKV